MLVHGWFGCYGVPGWRSRSARLQRRFWGSAAKSVDAGLQPARHVAHVQVGLVEDIAQPAKGGPALGLMGLPSMATSFATISGSGGPGSRLNGASTSARLGLGGVPPPRRAGTPVFRVPLVAAITRPL